MGDSQFSWALLAGVSLVIGSVFLYTLNPLKVKAATPDVPNRAEEAGGLLDELLYSDEEEENAELEDEEEGKGAQLRVMETTIDGKGASAEAIKITKNHGLLSLQKLILCQSEK
jgi:hypothetical protein